MNKFTLAKQYIKHPFFLGLGSNLLLGATVGLGASSIMQLANIGDSPSHLVAALSPIIANIGLGAFIYMNDLELNENNKFVRFYNPFFKLVKKIVNQYINTKESHLLDLNNNSESDENIKRTIKHLFFSVFCVKENYGRSYISTDNTVEFNFNIFSQYFYTEAYNKTLSNEQTKNKLATIIQEVFHDFKNETLFADILKERKVETYSRQNSLTILLQLNQISSIITEKDTHALTSLFKNSSIRDDIAEQLFTEKNYQSFPKHFRQEVIKHISANFLEQNKAHIFEMEKALDSSIVDEIKQTQHKTQLENIQKNIEESDKNDINATNLEKIALHVPKEVKAQIDESLNNAQYLSENMTYLSPTQHIEFKNLINNILPKYMSLFVEQELKNETQLNEVIGTLKLINECLSSFKEEVQLQKSSNLEAYQGFIHSKLQHFRDSQELGQEAENKQTLKSNM